MELYGCATSGWSWSHLGSVGEQPVDLNRHFGEVVVLPLEQELHASVWWSVYVLPYQVYRSTCLLTFLTFLTFPYRGTTTVPGIALT